MIKVKEIVGFNSFHVYNNSILVENKESLQFVNEQLALQPLVTGDIHQATVLNNMIIYQVKDDKNIHNYDRKISIENNTAWRLLFAVEYDIFIYIYTYVDSKPRPILMDYNLRTISDAPKYCDFSYGQYLFHNQNRKKTFICYKLCDKLWDYEHTDDSRITIISGYKDKLLLHSESGDLFALNLQDGSLCWKYPEQCPYGRCCYYEDSIYWMYKNEFREISADTGELLKVVDIMNLREKENFSATAGIKAYDEYLFARDVSGAVAVIDRKTLAVKEILRFDNHLINRDYTLHWVNNRLYVQDVEYIIHVFE